MNVQPRIKRKNTARPLFAVTAAALISTCAFAQPAPPSGAPAASPIPEGIPVPLGAMLFEPVLTPTQKIVQALRPPNSGALFPLKPLGPNDPLPSPNPRDLSGTWNHNQALQPRIQKDMFGRLLPYTLAGAAVLARRVNADTASKPYLNASAECRPPGPQWQHDLNFPFHIYHFKQAVEFQFEEYHGRWNIVFDPKMLPAGKEYMGRSVGHWDGNTLVVETTDFKQRLWLDVEGTPLSANGKLIQRIRKIDNGDRKPYLEILTTVIDPVYYTAPWSIVRSFSWQPDMATMKEYNCEEQVGDPVSSPNIGLLQEPAD